MTVKLLQHRARRALRAVKDGVDAPLALSYVVWPAPSDPHFGMPTLSEPGAKTTRRTHSVSSTGHVERRTKAEAPAPVIPLHSGNWKEDDIVGETDIYT